MNDRNLRLGEAMAQGGPCCAPRLPPRDRIVASARELFHKHGIRGIGVDAIAEAASTNKMTLYRHFESKDALIVECLRQLWEEKQARWSKLDAEYAGRPREELHAWVRLAAEYVASDRRGCDMANTAIELCEAGHPAHRVIAEYNKEMRARLAGLAAAAGLREPDLVADALMLLVEGARVSRQSVGADGPSAGLVQLGDAIIAAFDRPEAASEALTGTNT